MLKRILKDAIAFFNTLCVFLPFGLAAILAVVFMLGGWEKILPEHTLSYYFLEPVNNKLAAVIMIMLVAGLFYRFSEISCGKRQGVERRQIRICYICLFLGVDHAYSADSPVW